MHRHVDVPPPEAAAAHGLGGDEAGGIVDMLGKAEAKADADGALTATLADGAVARVVVLAGAAGGALPGGACP